MSSCLIDRKFSIWSRVIRIVSPLPAHWLWPTRTSPDISFGSSASRMAAGIRLLNKASSSLRAHASPWPVPCSTCFQPQPAEVIDDLSSLRGHLPQRPDFLLKGACYLCKERLIILRWN